MNLNDFVVLPNNKAKSVKLNARNLQEVQMETVTLAHESKEMEEKLRQLKECMNKEKEERGHSGRFRWKSGNSLSHVPKNSKENGLNKLSAGKVKIRVLKDEPLTAPPQPLPPPPGFGLRATRKNRLRGTQCGQCEVKTAGIRCAECTEDYCVRCFTHFHQRGALKHHTMIPMQTDLQTHVTTRDVVQKQNTQGVITSQRPINSNAVIRRGDENLGKRAEAAAGDVESHPHPVQVLTVNHGEESEVEASGEWSNGEDETGMALLIGEYNEEESARSFQEALRQWRGEASDGAGEQTVSVSATQVDPVPDSAAEGQGRAGAGGNLPVRVEFTENFTYMDRLLLKKDRRTPVETHHPSVDFCPDVNSVLNTDTEEETASSLTAQEEDFRRYYASLFAVPVSLDRTEPQIMTPESCLAIEILDERDTEEDFIAEQTTDNNREVQEVFTKGSPTFTGDASCISSSSPQPSRQSRKPAKPKAAQELRPSKPQTSQAEHSLKSTPSKSKPPGDTSRTSKTSIKTPTSTSQKPNCSPFGHKSKPDRGSPRPVCSPSLPRSQAEIPKSSHRPGLFSPDVSPLTTARTAIPEEHLSPCQTMSPSLRSTFTISQSDSFESNLLPKVYQSASLQKGSDSSLFLEQPQFSKFFPQPILSPKLSQFPSSNLGSSKQSLFEPESLLLDNQPQLSPVLSCQNAPPESEEQSPPVKTISLFNQSSAEGYSWHRSNPSKEPARVFVSSTPISGDQERVPAIPSHFLNVMQSPVKMEEDNDPSIDSGDEMSSDSLGLAPHEEDSSDDESQLHGHLTRGRSREEEGGSPATHADKDKDLQTDEREQLSEPFMVMHRQNAGSGSEQFCDADECPPLGLDTDSDQSNALEQTLGDSQDMRHTSSYDSHTTESNLSGESTPTLSRLPAARGLSRPTLAPAFAPALRPLSRAALEIMEICNVDQVGCEDPDLDRDATAHTLHDLEVELMLMTKETEKQTALFGALSSGNDKPGNHHFTRGRVDQELEDEEMTTHGDRESVLLLR